MPLDYDGFKLLIDRDYEKFVEQDKVSKTKSLKELRDIYNEWHEKMTESLEKYGFSNETTDNKDISIFMAKTIYFYYLAMFGWSSLRNYTGKLREEHEKEAEIDKRIIDERLG